MNKTQSIHLVLLVVLSMSLFLKKTLAGDKEIPFFHMGEGMRVVVNREIPIDIGAAGVTFYKGAILNQNSPMYNQFYPDENYCLLFKYFSVKNKQQYIAKGTKIVFGELIKTASKEKQIYDLTLNGEKVYLEAPQVITEFQEVETYWNSKKTREDFDTPSTQNVPLWILSARAKKFLEDSFRDNFILKCAKVEKAPLLPNGIIDFDKWTFADKPISVGEVKEIVGDWLIFYPAEREVFSSFSREQQ